MNLLINGLEILLLWIGGRDFGLMRVLLLGCLGILVIDFTLNGKSGKPMLLYPKSSDQVDIRITLQSALRLDGLRSSHPIEVPVKKADEINQMFPPCWNF